MRVLFACWAWPTHFYPMVPLAWAFRLAGHDVLVACQPALLPTVARCGLPGAAVGTDVEIPAAALALPNQAVASSVPSGTAPPRRRLGMSVRIAEAMVDDLAELISAWGPDLVVHEPTTYAAPLAAALTATPTVRHLWGVDVHAPARAHEAEAFAGLCERLGLAGFDGDGLGTVDPCPERLQLPADYRRIPMRYTPFNGPGSVPRWLSTPPERRRICVTGGISRSWQAPQTAAARPATPPPAAAPTAPTAPTGPAETGDLARALADLDADVVLAVSPADRDRLGPLPDGVRVAVLLPLASVLPGCDLLVSRGGNGSLMTAVSAGTPQLCVPGQPADLHSARALADTGAGLVLDPGDASADAVRAAARRLLDEPGFRTAAGRLRDELARRPGPARTVTVIEQLVASHSAGAER